MSSGRITVRLSKRPVEEYVTLKVAAFLEGTSENNIEQRLMKGSYTTYKWGKHTFIRREELRCNRSERSPEKVRAPVAIVGGKVQRCTRCNNWHGHYRNCSSLFKRRG